MKRVVLLFVAALTLFALTGALAFAHDAEVTLTAQNGSGQNGSAELTDLGDGTTKVVVDITPSTEASQPIHIHAGTCANLTAKPAYPLTSVVNGKSETIVPVTVKELLASPFAINVHKSPTEASVYVSCGEIVMATDEQPGMPTTGIASLNATMGALVILALSMTVLGLRLARRRA